MAGLVSMKSEKDKSTGKAEGSAPELDRRPTSFEPYLDIMDLQNTAGNQAVSRLLQSDMKSAPPVVQDVLNSGNGKPLDPDTRAYMEDRFNTDFSKVRIHDNPAAHASAKSLLAKAYTHGSNIVFSSGWYEPTSFRSQKLIAHELTHIIQQSRGGSIQPTIDGTGSLEISARQASDSAILGQGSVAVAGASAIGIASEPIDEKLKDDLQVVAKLKASASTIEGSDVNNIQGALFEELVNEQIRSYIKDNRDIEKLLPPLPKEVSASSIKFVDKHPNDLVDGEATFVEAKRNDKPFIQIQTLGPRNAKGERASSIQNFSDGAVFVRVKGVLRTKIIEGKSGERRKSDLWRGARDDDSQKTTWPIEQDKVRKEAQQGLHEYDPKNPSIGRTPATKPLPKGKFKETELGGQIRSDLEALDGGTLLVGGKEVKVLTRPSEVGFLAITPQDVDISGGIKKLKEMGLKATSDSVPISASTIRETAEQVVMNSKQKSGSPLPPTANPPVAPATPVSDTKAAAIPKPSASAAVTASGAKVDIPKTTVPVKMPSGKGAASAGAATPQKTVVKSIGKTGLTADGEMVQVKPKAPVKAPPSKGASSAGAAAPQKTVVKSIGNTGLTADGEMVQVKPKAPVKPPPGKGAAQSKPQMEPIGEAFPSDESSSMLKEAPAGSQGEKVRIRAGGENEKYPSKTIYVHDSPSEQHVGKSETPASQPSAVAPTSEPKAMSLSGKPASQERESQPSHMKTPRPIETVASEPNRTTAAEIRPTVGGTGADLIANYLPLALEVFGDMGIKSRVEEEFTARQPSISDFRLKFPEEGVLVVAYLQEEAFPDPEGRKARMFYDLRLQYGARTKQEALERWEQTPQLFGMPENWRPKPIIFHWIPPLQQVLGCDDTMKNYIQNRIDELDYAMNSTSGDKSYFESIRAERMRLIGILNNMEQRSSQW